MLQRVETSQHILREWLLFKTGRDFTMAHVKAKHGEQQHDAIAYIRTYPAMDAPPFQGKMTFQLLMEPGSDIIVGEAKNHLASIGINADISHAASAKQNRAIDVLSFDKNSPDVQTAVDKIAGDRDFLEAMIKSHTEIIHPYTGLSLTPKLSEARIAEQIRERQSAGIDNCDILREEAKRLGVANAVKVSAPPRQRPGAAMSPQQ